MIFLLVFCLVYLFACLFVFFGGNCCYCLCILSVFLFVFFLFVCFSLRYVVTWLTLVIAPQWITQCPPPCERRLCWELGHSIDSPKFCQPLHGCTKRYVLTTKDLWVGFYVHFRHRCKLFISSLYMNPTHLQTCRMVSVVFVKRWFGYGIPIFALELPAWLFPDAPVYYVSILQRRV